MAPNEPQHHGDEPAGSDESHRAPPGPITVTTTDPAIESAVEHRSDWKAHPDATVRVETSPASEPNPLYVAGARTVVIEGPRPETGRPDQGSRQGEGRGGRGREGQGRSGGSDDQGQGQSQDKGQDRGDRRDRPQPQQQPSMMKILLISAGTALLCGAIGAMGYSYFFGPSSDKSSGQSQG